MNKAMDMTLIFFTVLHILFYVVWIVAFLLILRMLIRKMRERKKNDR
ncbi:MAG: hypothetical protein Q4A75_05630 [Peptostreptococcaceae bacterium]|nr:hypothetical protein [Peptostreptococcaceae bacterium]